MCFFFFNIANFLQGGSLKSQTLFRFDFEEGRRIVEKID